MTMVYGKKEYSLFLSSFVDMYSCSSSPSLKIGFYRCFYTPYSELNTKLLLYIHLEDYDS